MPGGDAGDQLEGAADGGEGGAGIRPGGVLVIQHRDPAADACSGCQAMVQGKASRSAPVSGLPGVLA